MIHGVRRSFECIAPLPRLPRPSDRPRMSLMLRIGGRRIGTSAWLRAIADRSCILILRYQPTQINGVKLRAPCSGAVSAPAVTCIRVK